MAMLGGFNELSLQRSLRPWGDHMSSWSCTLGVKQEFEERNHKDLSNYQYFIDKLHPPPKKKTSFVFFVWVVNTFFGDTVKLNSFLWSWDPSLADVPRNYQGRPSPKLSPTSHRKCLYLPQPTVTLPRSKEFVSNHLLLCFNTHGSQFVNNIQYQYGYI